MGSLDGNRVSNKVNPKRQSNLNEKLLEANSLEQDQDKYLDETVAADYGNQTRIDV